MPYIPPEQILLTLKQLNLKEIEIEKSRRLARLSSLPEQMTLCNTTACNIVCFMCQKYAEPGADTKYYMKPELVKKIAHDSFLTLMELCLSVSGEPLVDPGLPLILKYACEYKVAVILVTNGLFLDREILSLLEPCLGHLTVSIDAATEKTYSRIRRRSNFTRVIDNIREFNRLRKNWKNGERPDLTLNFVMMKRNIMEAPLFLELARELEADLVTFNHVIIFNEKMKNESLLFHRETADRVQEEIVKKAASLGLEIIVPPLYGPAVEESAPPEEGTGPRKSLTPEGIEMPWRGCPFLWTRMFIEVNGDVNPCCADSPQRPIMGNAGRESIQEIWQGPLYTEMRARLMTDRPFECCLHCDIVSQQARPDDRDAFIKIRD